MLCSKDLDLNCTEVHALNCQGVLWADSGRSSKLSIVALLTSIVALLTSICAQR